jgi:ribonuclease P protein component
MLSKKYRLPSLEFNSNWESTIVSKFFILKIKDNNTKQNRIGIIISSSILKSAVRRNFWRRRIMEYFKLFKNDNKDFLIILSKNIKNCSLKEFKEVFSKTFINYK